MEPATLGIIGCGAISDVYFEAGNAFDCLRVEHCADLDVDRAEAKAGQHGVPNAGTVDELLENPAVEVAVVLTPPAYHAEVATEALGAGKHVYTEKPLAAETAQARELMELADRHDLLVGCAPDTFLGTGLQTCRDVIDDGRIGDPIGATVAWGNHGHEHWHPDPEGFYKAGGGPLFDMGPYYLSALVSLLGPVETVAGFVKSPFARREITSEPKRGQEIDVEVPTHETGLVQFEGGPTATILTSFDIWESELPGFEIYGTEGTLSVTNPNGFGGTPRVHRSDMADGEWADVPVERDHPGQQRGFGLIDLTYALRSGWEQRTSGAVAYHVLEIMAGIRRASEERSYVDLSAPCERPAPLPDGFPNIDP